MFNFFTLIKDYAGSLKKHLMIAEVMFMFKLLYVIQICRISTFV